jgi:hypothetical protein
MRDYWIPLIQASATIMTAVVLYVLRRLYHTMNSKMDRLLEVTAKAAKAEGVLEEKTRRDAEDKAIRGER